MTWKDAQKILHSVNFGNEEKGLSQVECQDVERLKSMIEGMDKVFEKLTEMDASVRVVMVLMMT